MTIDGMDCKIWQPTIFSKEWYSFKFRSGALLSKVVVCILTGDICWVNGPFKCGHYNDLTIFRKNLKNKLMPNEQVECDGGYRGDEKCCAPMQCGGPAEYEKKKEAGGRHKTINGRLKTWGILNSTYRHRLEMHGHAFMAIAVLTQLSIERGHRPYQVTY